MASVTLRYWGGARAAAGSATESVEAGSVADAVAAAVARRPGDDAFAAVMDRCSVLVDGTARPRAQWSDPLVGTVTVELLPPFAGGAS